MPNVTPSTILRPQTTQKAIVRTSRGIRRNAHYTRPSRSVLPPQPQPTVISEAGTKTLRLRQHGNQSLPLPPLMDPIAIEAKERHKKPKPGPEGQSMTDFQRELAANPHAQALATPVRQCNITKARLPSHFLLPFSTLLAVPEPPPEANTPPPKHPQPILVPSMASDLPQGSSTGSSTYVLNRQSMLDHLTRRNRWSSIVTTRMQETYAKMTGRKRVKVDKEWGWDEDMAERVLEKLRKEVEERLKGVLEDVRRTLVMPLHDIEDMGDVRVSAILEIGSALEANEEEKIGSSITPVYTLPELLGEEVLSQLPLEKDLKEVSHLAVLRHPRTVRLLLALDRLSMYALKREVEPQRKRIQGAG